MNMSEELQKLSNLKDRGVLTEEEFAAAKKRVIDAGPCTGDSKRAQSGLNNLRLTNRDRWLGGVCGGLAEQTGIPSWSWRILFVLTALLHGVGIVMYVLLWIFVPREIYRAAPVAAPSPPPVPPQG